MVVIVESERQKPVPEQVENIEHTARIANQEDHDTTALQAIRRHPRILAWCIYAIWMLVLYSFDNQAGGSVLSIPAFRKDFGNAYDGGYVLPVAWQSAFSGAPVASACIGSLGIGYIADRIGRRLSFAVGLVFTYVGVSLEFIATTNPVFFAGKFLNGFAIGGFVTLSYTYIGEITPTVLRGIISCAAAIAFTLGPLIVALILNSVGSHDNRWAYRSVFVAQYGVAAIGTVLLPFMPESPWWLLSKGREAKAAQALRQLGYTADEIERRMSAITLTLEEVSSYRHVAKVNEY